MTGIPHVSGTVRRSRIAVLALVLALTASCIHYGRSRRYAAKTTGTCPGACSHYQTCKGTSSDQQAYAICVAECREIYEDNPHALATYERLACEDAVAFIEGESGRGPGE